MNRSSTNSTRALGLIVPCLFASCASVRYEGKTFEARSEPARLVSGNALHNVTIADYERIGRLVVEVSTFWYERDSCTERAREEAASRGGDMLLGNTTGEGRGVRETPSRSGEARDYKLWRTTGDVYRRK